MLDTYTYFIKHLNKRLKIRLFIYFFLSILLVCVLIYDVLVDQVGFGFPLLGIGIGIVIGIFVSRIFKISWDENAQRVISEMDAFGVIILLIYIIFDVYRERLVEYFIHGPVVVATSFALLTGVMIGRVIGIRGRVIKQIEENL